uniref:BTB domain-containing protein n=1 Tax=Panagrellus redivivus TaxID=6233 RepID=A0A7E4VV77_PANRE
MPMATDTERLIEQISSLYLNEKLSDVTIIIEGVELPAHSLILAQRCEYFQIMFDSGMIESTSKRIKILETSVEEFKTVLKWVYTGCIHFTSLDNAFKLLRLAHMYQIKELIYEAVKYIWVGLENCI